jgi:TonB family protein
MARKARVEGKVILEAVIDTDGSVIDVKVLRSIPLLDKSAIEAVRRWKYRPALQQGRPVKVFFTVVVEFNLR